jgi:hypothetical protein
VRGAADMAVITSDFSAVAYDRACWAAPRVLPVNCPIKDRLAVVMDTQDDEPWIAAVQHAIPDLGQPAVRGEGTCVIVTAASTSRR